MTKAYRFNAPALLCLLLCLCILIPVVAPRASLAEMPAFTQTLAEGDEGEAVRALQERLTQLGYYSGAVNGRFDAPTSEALMLFQRRNALLESGMLDEITHRVLYSDAAVAWSPDTALEEAYAMDSAGTVLSAAPSGAASRAAGVNWSAWNFGPYVPEDYNTNEYGHFEENRFLSTATAPLSTFAADVDTASYAQLRAKILSGVSVPADSVRIEEMLNYFHYDYAKPASGEPFGVTMELADCPWNRETKLLLIGLQAQEIPKEERPAQNLVFLIDVSGSMDMPNKLPLVKRAFLLLLDELSPEDTVSIVTYASQDAVVLDGVRAGEKTAIMEAVNNLTAGGMTAGAAGIQTAYELAEKHLIPGGGNRVLLATDGDLNIGVSDEGSLVRLVEEKKKSGVFLSVLGFGDGNYKDNKLEALADHGDGNYSYIDTIYEARRALVTEIGATFLTVARDVKLQLDFNPSQLKGYRLIGYENRLMAAEDFTDDSKDGGEIGSGHRVTVLYELVPVGSSFDIGETQSKYQAMSGNGGDEWLTLSIRAKPPEGNESKLYTYPLSGNALSGTPSDNLRFAAAVAETGMLLRGSEWKGDATYESALDLLRSCEAVTGDVYKEEFLYLVTLLNRTSALSAQ